MSESRAPRQPALLRLHLQSWDAARRIRILSWASHARAHNKVALSAANMAMETQLSRQHTRNHPRQDLLDVQQYLDNDAGRWNEEQGDLVGRTRPDTSRHAQNYNNLLRHMRTEEE
ncbi:hypothetical protein PybrP1_010048 [[Pythium] brassicae (nom. inval.)]|nr:hypothetical protein PybrP1_010048 [[Pythium] brassicae (nom. inval.)]